MGCINNLTAHRLHGLWWRSHGRTTSSRRRRKRLGVRLKRLLIGDPKPTRVVWRWGKFFYVQNQQSVSSFLPLEWLFCGVYAILAIWLDFITHSCWNAMGLKVPSSAVDLCIRVRLTWLVTKMNRWTSPRCQVGSQNEAYVKLWQFDWEHMDILVQIQGFQNMRQPQACIKSFLNMIAAAKSRTCSPGIVKCHVSYFHHLCNFPKKT